MTKFSDLQAAYAQYTKSVDAYWEDLTERVIELVDGFRNYLAPEKHSFVDHKGRTYQYVEAGTYKLGEFTPSSRIDLDAEGEDMVMNFAFRIFLDDGADSYPKQTVILPVGIKKKDGAYQVILFGNDGDLDVTLKLSKAAYSSDKDRVYEALAQKVLRRLSVEEFN
ncbi:hypothetical protein ACVA51_13440 [Pseudomonas luteola]